MRPKSLPQGPEKIQPKPLPMYGGFWFLSPSTLTLAPPLDLSFPLIALVFTYLPCLFHALLAELHPYTNKMFPHKLSQFHDSSAKRHFRCYGKTLPERDLLSFTPGQTQFFTLVLYFLLCLSFDAV